MFVSTVLTLLAFMPSISNALPKPQGGGGFSNSGPTVGTDLPLPLSLTTHPN